MTKNKSAYQKENERLIQAFSEMKEISERLFIIKMRVSQLSLNYQDIESISNFFDTIEVDVQKLIREIQLKVGTPIVD